MDLTALRVPQDFYLLTHPNPNLPQVGFPRRHGRELTGAIVLHDAENVTDLFGPDGGAEAVARYLATRTTYGSYHGICDRDSTVPLAPPWYEAWHDTSSNPFAVGLCVAWRLADLATMTRAQRDAYYVPFAELVADHVRWFAAVEGITVPTDRFLSRAEVLLGRPGLTTHSRMDPSRRRDPFATGSAFEAEFLEVLARVLGTVTPAPPPLVLEPVPPAPAPPTAPAAASSFLPLAVDGDEGHRTVTEEQRALRGTGDYRGWVEADRGLAAVRGPVLKGAEQRFLARRGFYRGRIDGDFGPMSITAEQRWLKGLGLYTGMVEADHGRRPVRGPMTIKALQRALNTRKVS